MKGFANVISFRKISNEDINDVEEFIRTELLGILSTDANDSFGGDCDAIIDHEILVQHFGSRFASDTSNFKFERGDRIFINEIVLHVKTAAEGAGIHQFRMKRKKMRDRTKIAPKKIALHCAATNKVKMNGSSANREHTTNIENQATVKTRLIEKVKDLLESFKIEPDEFEEEMVHVNFDDENFFGSIQCVVCEKSGIKSKPYRVYYCRSSDSNFWVISNFKKHLEKTHQLVATKTVAIRRKQVITDKKVKKEMNVQLNGTKTKNNELAENSSSIDIEIVSLHSDDKSSITDDDDVVLLVVDDKDNETDPNLRLLNQISSQMTNMVTATLNNAEILESMPIEMRKEARQVSVVKTDGDGNCLPSALAHQLFQHPIGSKAHIAKTTSLRSSVVEHILLPENISRYRIPIEEHMMDIDIKVTCQSECENFVRDTLSKSGEWMGLETLKAVSNMYAVTIIIFNEEEGCYAIRGDAPDYDRAIVIAYRLSISKNGGLVYNHYDSVVDIDPYTLHDSVNFITKKVT